MFHKIEVVGSLVALDTRKITADEYDRLVSNTTCESFDLRCSELSIGTIYGFEVDRSSPQIEIKLNGGALPCERSIAEDFEFTYLKLAGSIRPLNTPEQFYLIVERKIASGRAELFFGGSFQPTELRFEVDRFGMLDESVKSILSPTYKGQYFNSDWTKPCETSCSVISSKGKLLRLPIKRTCQ